VKRDTSLIFKGRLNKSDTLLYDNGLKPNENYKYTAYAELNGQRSPQTVAEIITMDTTSHNFSWTTYEFGGGYGTSYFKDVSIIDENDIWAVGEIHTSDTDQWNEDSTEWVQPYNAAHWDGQNWELRRISNTGYPRRIVYSFSKNDVWFDGSIKWDGVGYSVHMKNFPLMPNGDGWYKNSMWGASNNDFYVVGDHGMIAHYDGQSWTKIESGTDLPINDIFGFNNELYLPACYVLRSPEDSDEKKLICLQDNKVSNEYWPYDRKITSVWTDEKNMLYTCGAGIFKKYAKNK
jgi:hypothetical protein